MKYIFNGVLSFLFVITSIFMILGVKPYVTISGSMEPEIKTGSICFVNTCFDFYEIEIGDVIAYETLSGSLVTHRVVDISENKEAFITKGDNNDVNDGWSTTSENFHGKTMFAIPYMGYGIVFIQKSSKHLVVISIMLVVFNLLIKELRKS